MPRRSPPLERPARPRPAAATPAAEPRLADYRALAELRYQIRIFLRFSEDAARQAGIEPQQHQLLLAIKGLPAGRAPTIKNLAERLCLRHHSTVALVDHLEARALVRRQRNDEDRREILLRLTSAGEELLRGLSVLHRQQFRTIAPVLVGALTAILPIARRAARRSHL
jgi:DNA-binding MarR family transcriptional regulator